MAAVRQQKARRIAGAATAESDWQSWLPLLHPPALDWAALVAGAQRLVVVAPHPDDELLACGGALAMQAVRGGHSLVIGVTDGERTFWHWQSDNAGQVNYQSSLGNLARDGREPLLSILLGPIGSTSLQRYQFVGNLLGCVSQPVHCLCEFDDRLGWRFISHRWQLEIELLRERAPRSIAIARDNS